MSEIDTELRNRTRHPATIARLNARVEELSSLIDRNHTDAMIAHRFIERLVGEQARGRDFAVKVPMAEEWIADLTAKLAEVEGERDRQYEFNAGMIAKYAAAESALREAWEALQLLGNVNSWTDPTGPSGEWVIDVCRAARSPTRAPQSVTSHREQAISFAFGNVSIHNPAVTREMVAAEYDKLHPQPVEEGGEGRCPHGNTADLLKAIALNLAESARYGVTAAIHSLEEPASKYTTDLSTARAEVVALTAERDALRAAIEKAPHENSCATVAGPFLDGFGAKPHYPCDCWKAAVPRA